MSDLTLQPMTSEYYQPWITRLMAEYAQEHVKAGNWSAEEATSKAESDTAKLLPDGVHTAGQLLFTAHDASEQIVGVIWIGLDRPNDGAWVYEIEVLEAHRGSGFGRSLLAAGERAAKDAGAATIGLNVFGPNATARALYESSGYEVTTIQMRKPL